MIIQHFVETNQQTHVSNYLEYGSLWGSGESLIWTFEEHIAKVIPKKNFMYIPRLAFQREGTRMEVNYVTNIKMYNVRILWLYDYYVSSIHILPYNSQIYCHLFLRFFRSSKVPSHFTGRQKCAVDDHVADDALGGHGVQQCGGLTPMASASGQCCHDISETGHVWYRTILKPQKAAEEDICDTFCRRWWLWYVILRYYDICKILHVESIQLNTNI